jgi:anti-anti-sigma factor
MELKKSVIDDSRNIITLQISGRIKSAYLSKIETELQALSGARPVFLILDLTGIEAIDSTGIGLLIKVRRDFLQAGGNVVLWAGARVQSVIKLSGLENYFKLAGSQEEARELVMRPPEPEPVKRDEPEDNITKPTE